MEKEKIEKLTIGDVLVMPEYAEEIGKLIKELKDLRIAAQMTHGGNLKAHVIDRLIERDIFNVGDMTVAFAQVMNKEAKGYSAAERRFILDVGIEAFNSVMKGILNEEKADTSNGED